MATIARFNPLLSMTSSDFDKGITLPVKEGDALTRLSAATTALAEARTLDDVKRIIDIAEAARTYARAAKLGLEAANYAAEIKLRAERKAGEMFSQLEKSEGGRPQKTADSVSAVSEYRQTIDEVDVNERVVRRWQTENDVPEEVFEQHLAEVKADGDELSTAGLLRVAKKLKRKKIRQDITIEPTSNGVLFTLYHEPICNLDTRIEPASLDAIVTDPPYPREYLPVYEQLARFAAYALKPGGSLVVMVGQSYLPEILAAMCPIITYQWTAAYLTPGGQAVQLWQRKVNAFWKPLLWFVQGEYSGKWIGDVAKSPPNHNDKRFHDWGQSELGMVDILERFTNPGELVCDPFLGAGTTALAAVQLGRRFVGADIDNEQVMIAQGRLGAQHD
jgi:16S rRNA G966 N2-methylase RsmD